MFITQTEPKKSKEVQSKIRKHVMKDIGKARRKETRRGKPLQFTLEVPDSLEDLCGLPVVEDLDLVEQPTQPRILEESVPPVNQNFPFIFNPGASEDSVRPSIKPHATYPTHVISSIERVWTGRMDPFINYPIEMDRRSLELIDHGKANLSMPTSCLSIDVSAQSSMTDMEIYLRIGMHGSLWG